MPRLNDLHEQIRGLSEETDEREIDAVARAIADRCRSARHPFKSLAAVLRHQRGTIPINVFDRLAAIAESALRHIKIESSVSVAAAIPFVGLGEAARRLGLSAKTLAERLRDPQYRRLYGWPWWDGHQWFFSPAALDPAERAKHLADLPEAEPAAHAAMLPVWCAPDATPSLMRCAT